MPRHPLTRWAALAVLAAVPACSDSGQPTAPDRTLAHAQTVEPQVAQMAMKGKQKFVVARVTASLNPSDDTYSTVTAICPEGSIATGGGHYGWPSIEIVSSYPLTADDELPLEGESAARWEVLARNNPGQGQRSLTVFVICSN